MQHDFITNKQILVTGGTGSLGKELVRHLLKNEQPEIVRIYDVRDKEGLARAVEDVDIIFHTAALNHVMACEYNPFEVGNYYFKYC